MIEIISLAVLWRILGIRAREKGRIAIGYQLLMVFLWFAGEFAAGFVGILFLFVVYGEAAPSVWFFAYPAMIAGAALGAWGAFCIVKSLPDRHSKEAEFYRDSNIEIT